MPPDPTFKEVPVMAPNEPVPVVWMVPDPAFSDVLVKAPNDPDPVV